MDREFSTPQELWRAHRLARRQRELKLDKWRRKWRKIKERDRKAWEKQHGKVDKANL